MYSGAQLFNKFLFCKELIFVKSLHGTFPKWIGIFQFSLQYSLYSFPTSRISWDSFSWIFSKFTKINPLQNIPFTVFWFVLCFWLIPCVCVVFSCGCYIFVYLGTWWFLWKYFLKQHFLILFKNMLFSPFLICMTFCMC